MIAYHDDRLTVYHGDCLDVLAELADAAIDAVVTDPPYGLEFMGKEWDSPARMPGHSHGLSGGWQKTDGGHSEGYRQMLGRMPQFQQWCQLWAAECLRVLKPGGHLLAFGGTRTAHRLACAIEDAGFEIRDSIAWLYGSGFPKSLDVSKAIDKARNDDPSWRRVGAWLRAAREHRGLSAKAVCTAIGSHGKVNHGGAVSNWENGFSCPTWDQWLALRESIGFGDEMDAEVWRLNGRKGTPGEAWDQREVVGEAYRVRRESVVQIAGLSDGAFPLTTPATDDARRWEGWGTALKPAHEPIVVARKPLQGTVAANVLAHGTGALHIDACRVGDGEGVATFDRHAGNRSREDYRTGAVGRWPTNVVLDDATAAELDEQSGVSRSQGGSRGTGARGYAGGALGAQPDVNAYGDTGGASRFFPTFRYQAKAPTKERPKVNGVAHPTVKPLELMRWLVRLVTPPDGVVLDLFAGSGTTAQAALAEGFACVTIERDESYLPLIAHRLGIEIASTPALDMSLGLGLASSASPSPDELTDEEIYDMQPGQNPFSNPSAPGGETAPRPRDMAGCLVAFVPRAFTPAGAPGNTEGIGNSGPRDRVTTDIILLETPDGRPIAFGGSPEWEQKPTPHTHTVTAPARFSGAWISNSNIVRALCPGGQPLAGQMVLGRIVRSEMGQRPWNLDAVDGTPDMEKAIYIWSQIQMGAMPYQTPVPLNGVAPTGPQVSYAPPTAPAAAQAATPPLVYHAATPSYYAPAPAHLAQPGQPSGPTNQDAFAAWQAQQAQQIAQAAPPPPPVPPAPPGWDSNAWAGLTPDQRQQVLATITPAGAPPNPGNPW